MALRLRPRRTIRTTLAEPKAPIVADIVPPNKTFTFAGIPILKASKWLRQQIDLRMDCIGATIKSINRPTATFYDVTIEYHYSGDSVPGRMTYTMTYEEMIERGVATRA